MPICIEEKLSDNINISEVCVGLTDNQNGPKIMSSENTTFLSKRFIKDIGMKIICLTGKGRVHCTGQPRIVSVPNWSQQTLTDKCLGITL